MAKMEKVKNNAWQCCILLILMLLQGIPMVLHCLHISPVALPVSWGLTALKNRDLQNAVARLLSQGFPHCSNVKATPSLCLLHHLGFFRVGGVDEVWEDFVGGCQTFLGDQVAAMSSQSFHKFSKLLCTMPWGWMVVAVQSLSHVRLCYPMDCCTARFPCSSPSPGSGSNSCPVSQWCHQTISSSAVSFSSCL